jgi:hypothetical protein
MAKPGWLNDNEYRAYPFIPQDTIEVTPSGVMLPSDLIVDGSFIMGLEAEFDDAQDSIYLHEVRRTATTLEIELRTTAQGANAYSLVFTRDLTATEWQSEHQEAIRTTSLGSESSESSAAEYACGDSPRWEGSLTTGRLETILTDLLSEGDAKTFTAGEWQVEPARIQNLRKAFLQSIGLANYDRTRWQADPDCDETVPGAPPVYVNKSCLDGPLRLKEGFNCTIRQEDASNTILISAALGGGSGLACVEVPLYAGEEPPEGSRVLSGGPTCTDVLKTINGVGGRVIRLLGGQGIQVTAAEESPHTVFITIGLQGFAYCPDSEE